MPTQQTVRQSGVVTYILHTHRDAADRCAHAARCLCALTHHSRSISLPVLFLPRHAHEAVQMQKFQLFQWDGVGDNGIGVAIDMRSMLLLRLASVKCGSPVKMFRSPVSNGVRVKHLLVFVCVAISNQPDFQLVHALLVHGARMRVGSNVFVLSTYRGWGETA